MKKLHKQNSSFNQKMPKLMSTDNNKIIHNHENKKIEKDSDSESDSEKSEKSENSEKNEEKKNSKI